MRYSKVILFFIWIIDIFLECLHKLRNSAIFIRLNYFVGIYFLNSVNQKENVSPAITCFCVEIALFEILFILNIFIKGDFTLSFKTYFSLDKDVSVCVHVCSHSLGPALCNTMDYSPPCSIVHDISQAGILKWVAISSSMESSWLRDRHCLLHLLHWQADSLPLVTPEKPCAN